MSGRAVDRQEQARRAKRLRELHAGPGLLVLPNAWDAAVARVLAEVGFPALATTSGGIATSLGYPDGERIPADAMLAAVARIAQAVPVPVTADMESGYGLPADELVEQLLATGAVGLNLEDSDLRGPGPLVDAEVHAERLAAVKAAARARGVDVVLNARVDVHLRQVGPPEGRLDEAIRRARIYRRAGADGVFPIFLRDEDSIGALVRAVDAPVNVLATPDTPSIDRLRALGVRRVSFGSGLQRQLLARLREIAEGLLPA